MIKKLKDFEIQNCPSKINEIIEYLSTQEKLGILVDNTGKEPSKKVQETSDINLSEYNPFTMLKGMISEKYGNMYRDINDFINNIEKDYISKKELKEKINAIDIKHISSNEMFRIEVLDLIQDF